MPSDNLYIDPEDGEISEHMGSDDYYKADEEEQYLTDIIDNNGDDPKELDF